MIDLNDTRALPRQIQRLGGCPLRLVPEGNNIHSWIRRHRGHLEPQNRSRWQRWRRICSRYLFAHQEVGDQHAQEIYDWYYDGHHQRVNQGLRQQVEGAEGMGGSVIRVRQ